MSNKILFNCVYGKEDPERATLPFVAANVAAASGQEAVVVEEVVNGAKALSFA